MQVYMTMTQANLVMRLIRTWSESDAARNVIGGALDDALDALQLSMSLTYAIGQSAVEIEPSIAGIASGLLSRDIAASKDAETQDQRRVDAIRVGPPLLIKVGDFLTCHDDDVEHFRGLGYTVTRDEQLRINFASPAPFCTHGKPFTEPCEFCAADQNRPIEQVEEEIHPGLAWLENTGGDPAEEVPFESSRYAVGDTVRFISPYLTTPARCDRLWTVKNIGPDRLLLSCSYDGEDISCVAKWYEIESVPL
jgi:hypothetical protein